MSPMPAAPSSASITAWASTSASEWPSRPALVGDLHAADHEPASGGQAVGVEADADERHRPRFAGVAGLRARRVRGADRLQTPHASLEHAQLAHAHGRRAARARARSRRRRPRGGGRRSRAPRARRRRRTSRGTRAPGTARRRACAAPRSTPRRRCPLRRCLRRRARSSDADRPRGVRRESFPSTSRDRGARRCRTARCGRPSPIASK